MRLIFDLDNTLFDRDFAFMKTIEALFNDYQQDLSQQDRAFIQKIDHSGKVARRKFCHQLMQHYSFLPKSFTALWRHFEKLPEFIQVEPDTIRTLQRLSAHHELILLTNGSVSMQSRKIEKLGLRPYFKKIFISETYAMSKPDPKLFTIALEDTPASSNIMIGDDAEKDILGASNLGIKTIWISSSKEKIACDMQLSDITKINDNILCSI